MENLSFVLWMIGWPFVLSIKYHWRFERKEVHSKYVGDIASILEVIAWIWIANLLYVR